MAHFHLNLFEDVDVPDDEGADYPDLAAARGVAIAGAREIMAGHILSGAPINLSHRIEIADADGGLLAVIPFRDLLRIVD